MKLKMFSVVVAVFLPGRAKDLSAHLYKNLFTLIKKFYAKVAYQINMTLIHHILASPHL
jgi:hypothetical protein